MIQKALPAFGYVVVKNWIDAGDVINDEVIHNNTYSISDPSPRSDGKYGDTGTGYTWLYATGKMSHTNTATQEITHRKAGWSNLVDPEKVGEFRIEILEPMVTFCLNSQLNSNRSPTIPHVEYFALAAGNAAELPIGTKLFLADGVLLIDGREIRGARQIKCASGAKNVEAQTDCYGFIFP